jgi:hypothetical protein
MVEESEVDVGFGKIHVLSLPKLNSNYVERFAQAFSKY